MKLGLAWTCKRFKFHTLCECVLSIKFDFEVITKSSVTALFNKLRTQI
jgi:hypothetical protein